MSTPTAVPPIVDQTTWEQELAELAASRLRPVSTTSGARA